MAGHHRHYAVLLAIIGIKLSMAGSASRSDSIGSLSPNVDLDQQAGYGNYEIRTKNMERSADSGDGTRVFKINSEDTGENGRPSLSIEVGPDRNTSPSISDYISVYVKSDEEVIEMYTIHCRREAQADRTATKGNCRVFHSKSETEMGSANYVSYKPDEHREANFAFAEWTKRSNTLHLKNLQMYPNIPFTFDITYRERSGKRPRSSS